MPIGQAVQGGLVTFLPWIPGTLAVVSLSLRFPVTRDGWLRTGWIHLAAIPVVTFGVNVLVVLGFWITSRSFGGMVELARQGAFWATLRIHVGAALYIAIAGVTQGIQYYRATRAKELHVARLEGQLTRARLETLNAQIRPHFLFNTLHTIGQLWRSGRSDDADELLDHLGLLFRRVQSTASEPEVPLSEELGMVRDYLAIEQVRFKDRLSTQVHATPEALSCLVPPLLLQPLVENAIRHGISAASSAGSVVVRALVEADTLRVEVRDDGPGPRAETSSAGAGTGLRNARERLDQLYGSEASLEAGPAPNGGFLVRLKLPARTGPLGATTR